MNAQQKKVLTLCIIEQEGKVLLGMKKRGFGAGRYNGFGGKVEIGESIEEAAIRETQEEACITPLALRKLGIVEFYFVETEDLLEVHIFKSRAFEGEVGESEEMRPQWFAYDDVPYSDMWKDDIFWFPYFRNNRLFRGRFSFDANDAIVDHELQEVEALD